jgi:hypothetical protein
MKSQIPQTQKCKLQRELRIAAVSEALRLLAS